MECVVDQPTLDEPAGSGRGAELEVIKECSQKKDTNELMKEGIKSCVVLDQRSQGYTCYI
jgi:hypothetical protein